MINNQFTYIISKPSADFGRTHLVEMDLPTTGLPVASKPYTIPLKYKSFIDEKNKTPRRHRLHFKINQQLGITHLHHTEKPNPSQPKKLYLRMCIDYRKVNQSLITACNGKNGKVVSTFPLPKIQELLSR